MMVADAPASSAFAAGQSSNSDPFCGTTTYWELFPEYTNIWDREPTPTNVTHGTLHFIGEFDSVDECFAAVNASKDGPFHSFTYNDATVKDPYGRHCWADTSFTWQNRGSAKGQISGRGPGFPVYPPPPPLPGFTHDHLTGLREVAYDANLNTLISNPVRELAQLRNGTLAAEDPVTLTPGAPHVVAGTGAPVDASTADVLADINIPSGDAAAVALSVLANVTAGVPVGGVQTMINFSAADANGTIHATASIRTLNPCGGETGVAEAPFPILKGENVVDLRVLVDRSVVEVFIMGGRVVFSKTFLPNPLYVPDTNVVLEAWGTTANASVAVFSMGCGWTDPPYSSNPSSHLSH